MDQQIVNSHAVDDSGTALVQQLDSAIGQTSTVMGTLVHELIRRSLRDGVLQIGQGLHSFAAEKVDAAVADWKPALEETAARVSRDEAQETATQVAQGQLAQLSSRIDLTAQSAEETSVQLAQDLQEKIEVVERRTRKEVLAEVDGQLHQLRGRSQKATRAIKERLTSLETTCANLERLLKILEERSSWLNEELAKTRTAQEDFEEHVRQLEESRGWRGLGKRLFFWKKKDGAG